MIALLLVWSNLLAASLVYGSAISSWTGSREETRQPDALVMQAFQGLFAICSLALGVSLFLPLSLHVSLAILYVTPLLLLARKQVRNQLAVRLPARTWLILATMAVTAGLPLSGVEYLPDTDLYHYQLIRWLGEEGWVRGLSLLDYRYAYASSWFAGTALFEHGPLAGRMYGSVSGFTFVLILFQFSTVLGRVVRREAGPGDAYFSAGAPVVLGYSVFEAFVKSPSPNLGAAVAIFLAGWMTIAGVHPLRILLLSAGGFAVKLSVAPVLLLAAIASAREGTGPRQLRVFALAAVIALPVVAANGIASGCPFFPSALGCRDAASATAAHEVTWIIRNWGRYAGEATPPGASFWSLDWLAYQAASPRHAAVFGLTALCLAALAWWRAWSLAALMGALGIAYCLAASPDHRFAIGFTATLVGCSADAWLARHAFPGWLRLPGRGVSWLVPLALGVVMAAGARLGETLVFARTNDATVLFSVSRLVLPPMAFSAPGPAAITDVNGVRLWRPQASRKYGIPMPMCGAGPKPCLYSNVLPSLRLCRPEQGVRGGFCR